MLSEGAKKGKKRRKEEKEEKKGRKGEKKGRERKGKEGKGEYEDSVGGYVGWFFFQSPEVCQKLGRQTEFLGTGDFTTVAARLRGSRRRHRTSAWVFDSRTLRKTTIISCCQRGERKERREERKKKKRRKGGKVNLTLEICVLTEIIFYPVHPSLSMNKCRSDSFNITSFVLYIFCTLASFVL